MPGRNGNTGGYRYGFNGKEMDDEAKNATGTQYDYGFRIYDPRVGRFLSVDPLTDEFAWNSPYSYAENDVNRSIDLDGLEKILYTTQAKELFSTFIRIINEDEVLKKTLYTSITKPELREKVYVYFTTSSKTYYMGETLDNNKLVGFAKAVMAFDALPANHSARKDREYVKEIENTRNYLLDAGLSPKKIIERYNAGITQFAILANKSEIELEQLKIQAHEINLHLINDINGGNNKTAEEEHIEAFGKETYERLGIAPIYSPDQKDIPQDKLIKQILDKIDKAYEKVKSDKKQ